MSYQELHSLTPEKYLELLDPTPKTLKIPHIPQKTQIHKHTHTLCAAQNPQKSPD
jgi:hypothetical protein